MLAYLLRRVIYTGVVVTVTGIISFMLIHLAPGDPAALILGSEAGEDQIQE